jgi:hypothetical protein
MTAFSGDYTEIMDFIIQRDLRNFWLDLRCFGILHTVEWQSFTERINPFFTLEKGTNTSSRNIGKGLPLDAA